MGKKTKLKLKPPTTKKFNSGWVKGIIVKSKVFKDSTGGYLYVLRVRKEFLKITQKAKS